MGARRLASAEEPADAPAEEPPKWDAESATRETPPELRRRGSNRRFDDEHERRAAAAEQDRLLAESRRRFLAGRQGGPAVPPPAPPPPPLPPRWSAADPYVVLGVPAGAPRPQLRKAYLALALQYHPDKNTNASASGAFAAISRAWKAVSSA